MAILLLENKILNESKRDDLLLPYLEIYNNKTGQDMQLGQFKQRMHKILVVYGGFHNLSLESNYYLAGVTRYYFEGQLTTNKDLSVFKENFEAERDTWNVDVCRRLDALIVVLRNAYIDSIGTQFEQPEDFGTLSLAKLLRKYNKKINAQLGIEVTQTENEPTERVDLNKGRIGSNGYSYDIMYSQTDCSPYQRATEPGAWCITYSLGNYQYYTSRMASAHFIVFLKDGYENIPREVGRGFTNEKPHDAYGNSMIALLQGDNDGRSIFITSRWNHGAGGPEGRVEADHAYTEDEFLNIVGITKNDLNRLYNIWKENKKFHSEEVEKTEATMSRAEKTDLIRKIKYAQMKIRGGASPEELFTHATIVYGNGKTSKSIFMCQLESNENTHWFLMDKGNIIFETISFPGASSLLSYNKSEDMYNEPIKVSESIFLEYKNYWMIYDARRHKLLDIDGKTKFKAIPRRHTWRNGVDNPAFYEVRLTHNTIALVSTSSNTPLQLPNGDYWSAEIRCYGRNSSYRRREIRSFFVGDIDKQRVLELVYDESSHETYYYDVVKKTFITLKKPEQITDDIWPSLDCGFMPNNYFIVSYGRGHYVQSLHVCYDLNGNPITIDGQNVFSKLTHVNDTIIGVELIESNPDELRNGCRPFDLTTNSFITIQGRDVLFNEGKEFQDTGIIEFLKYGYGNGCYLFDNNNKTFFLNPLSVPSRENFIIYHEDIKENGTIEISTDSRYWYAGHQEYKIKDLKRVSM